MTGKHIPEPPPEVDPVLEAAAAGRLLIQRCGSCGRYQFYPRVLCVSCASEELAWVGASGRGSVHTFAVVHANRAPGWAEEVPYVVAVVDLEEGPRITTNVVGCPPDEVRVGMEVQVTFVEDTGVTLPKFRPVG